jgi:hypothetical protein
VKAVSPRGFLATAAAIGVLYGLAHLAGLRDDTAILSGTAPPSGVPALGLVYVALHFAWVIGVPVLGLGALVFWGMDRALRRGSR